MVRPTFKKNERNKVGNYKPVSILNGMLKIYERYIHNSLSSCAKTILSNFILAYRKPYSSNHVLLRPIENWKKSSIIGTVLVDLSKTFDCIPHDLLAGKLHAYAFFFDSLHARLSSHYKAWSYKKKKRVQKILQATENLFRKNLQLKDVC